MIPRTKSIKIEWSDLWVYGLLVVMPMILALGIYATLRTDPPKVLLTLISWSSHPPYHLPRHLDWLAYNLPDGLWAFSMTSFLLIAGRHDSKIIQRIYLVVGLFVMLALEIFQGSALPGTFDTNDVVSIVVGYLSSLAIFKHSLRRRCLNIYTK